MVGIARQGQPPRDYLTFKDLLVALAAYRIDLNSGRSVTKADYISMSQFLFMQICQQGEMSIHLSQFGDSATPRNTISHKRSMSPTKNIRPINSVL